MDATAASEWLMSYAPLKSDNYRDAFVLMKCRSWAKGRAEEAGKLLSARRSFCEFISLCGVSFVYVGEVVLELS